MIKINTLLGILFAILSSPAYAYVTCPHKDQANNIYNSKIYEKSLISIEKENDENYPISLVLYKNKKDNLCEKEILDKYSIEGSSLNVRTLFFYTIKSKVNLITLVSWDINNRAEGTYGVLYQIYAYEQNDNGNLTANASLQNNINMSGIDGYSGGQPSKFKATNASEIKKLIKATFN